MKLSTKTRYGLRAVIEIAKASIEGVPAKRKDIAANQELSESYLENILIILKSNQLIEATRGAKGGYVLTRPPEAITVLEIINALEGTMNIVECVSTPQRCKRADNCATRSLWKELSDSWNTILGKVTLKEMVQREKQFTTPQYSI